MIFRVTPSKKQARVSKARLSFLTLAVLGAVIICPAVNAQGVEPDQDSLLPPEVVPLDPSAAGRMVQPSQPGQGQNFGSAPGLSNASVPTSNASDFRKAAFDSLMGQPVQMPVNNNPNLQSMQGQMGQMPSAPNQFGNQPNQFGNQFGGGATPGLVANNPVPTQSQTLSGGVKSPEVGKPSKLGGFKHSLGLATSFGGGIMTGVLMSRGNPMSLYSTGLMGVGLMNYGMRNSFPQY
jgi:hypothetical protein